MLCDLSVVAHPHGPPEQDTATEEELGKAGVPPRRDVLLVADKEGPLAVVLDVEVVVNVYLDVLSRVLLGQLQHERLVLVGRVVVAREEVEDDLDLDDRVDGRGVDEAQVGKVPPRSVVKVLDCAKRDDLSRRVGLDVWRLCRVEAADVVTHLGRLGHQRVKELLHLRRLAKRLLVVKRLGVQC